MPERPEDRKETLPTVSPDSPSAEDPYISSTPVSGGEDSSRSSPRTEEAIEMAKADPDGKNGPSYERDQSPEDKSGGSTDPHNTLTHSDSGNETVDGS